MEKIMHRVNTLSGLKKLDRSLGAEVDLRSSGSDIIMNHEPFGGGEKFSDFCQAYRHGTLVLNPKEDGLEGKILEMLEQSRIQKFFFLDLPMPTMVKLAKSGMHKLAVRLSKYEPVEGVLAMEGLCDWAWVDCFDGFILDEKNYAKLEGKFKICLVSPELQKRGKGEISVHKKRIGEIGARIDAVCTDFPELW